MTDLNHIYNSTQYLLYLHLHLACTYIYLYLHLYPPSVRLIIVVPLDSVTDFHIHRLLDNIFQCLVLLVGLDDLIALRNIDRNCVTRANS